MTHQNDSHSPEPEDRLLPSAAASPTRPRKDEEEDKPREKDEVYGFGARHVVAFLALLGIQLDYMLQSILSVTVVAMVGQPADDHYGKGEVCPVPEGANTTDIAEPGEFSWDERTQGILQGAVFGGCALATLPMGRLAEVMGGHRMFGLLLGSASLLCLLFPVAARTDLWLFVGVRVLQGAALAGVFPALFIVMVTWFPPEERAKYLTIILTGMNLGNVTCKALAGWLCELGWLGGWPAPFYVVGGAGVVWMALWFLVVYPSPEVHPRINQKELEFILSGGKRRIEQSKKFPWGPVLRCPYVWVLTLGGAGDCFGMYIIMTMVPTYLTNIQHFSLRNAGLIAALPYLLSSLVSVGWGCVVGCLIARRALTKRRIRQLSAGLGLYVPAGCMLGMCLVGCDKDAAVALLILSVCVNTCNYAGVLTSYQDLSPTFCGTIMGFAGIFSSLAGVVGPLVSGMMINETQTLGAWRNVFVTTAIVYIVACTVFLLFTPVQQHQWDNAAALADASTSSSNSCSSPSSRLQCYGKGVSKKAAESKGVKM